MDIRWPDYEHNGMLQVISWQHTTNSTDSITHEVTYGVKDATTNMSRENGSNSSSLSRINGGTTLMMMESNVSFTIHTNQVENQKLLQECNHVKDSSTTTTDGAIITTYAGFQGFYYIAPHMVPSLP